MPGVYRLLGLFALNSADKATGTHRQDGRLLLNPGFSSNVTT